MEVHRPGAPTRRSHSGAEAAFAVQQGGAHDAVVGAARHDLPFGDQLGAQKAAARLGPQAEGGDVHQPDAEARAGLAQRRGRHVVHAVVGFAAALAQDADRS